VATSTVALVNLGANSHEVDVWFTAASPPPANVAGPRSVHVGLAAGLVASVALGPVVATVGSSGTTVFVVAQRDTANPEDPVWVVADTGLMNRAGATGILAFGAAS